MWQIRAFTVLATVSAFAGLRMTARPSDVLKAQERHAIPDQLLCAQCTTELTTAAIIGDVHGPGALPRWPQTAWVDRLSGYWLTFDPGLEPRLFDRSGGNLSTPLRVADGPGEVRLVREM